jgi:hypothetical protein
VLLQAAAGANGSVSSTGGWYALGGSVTVTAVANSGYTFAGWSGEVSGDTNANPLTLTMDQTRSITANFSTNATGGNGLIWRVDFNGTGNDTLATSNFTGWAVSSTSRTQSFANVDGGSISSSITVRLLGTGTFGNYQRNMNAGSATNLYRDGGQNTASFTLAISNLTPAAGYTLKVWYFDDEYTLGTTQTYVNVTDGGSTTLGALTNTFTASATAGHASLPTGLYDTRYHLSANLTAGTNGQLNVSVTPSGGNAKINALELAAPVAAPETVTLEVTSAHGMSDPASGTNSYTSGDSVTVQVTNALLTMGSTQFVCLGWTGSGSVPASGTGTSVTFTITNASTLVWSWQTNYLLQAYADVHGSISTTGGWYRSVSNASITATGDVYYHFVSWTGDVASVTNPLSVLMDAPKSIWAIFAETLYTNDTPASYLGSHELPLSDEGALSDTDLDGMQAWEEYIAGTIPTQYVSRLIITNLQSQISNQTMAWPTVTGRFYSVYWSSNLSTEGFGLLTNLATGVFTDTLHGVESMGFYRIDVRMEQ